MTLHSSSRRSFLKTAGRPRADWTARAVLNMNFGLKYLLVRDVEEQLLGSVGFMYEPPMGERDVFENHGDGVMTAWAWTPFRNSEAVLRV